MSAARCAICSARCAIGEPGVSGTSHGVVVAWRGMVVALNERHMRSSVAKLSALTWGGAALSLVLSCSSRGEDSTGFSAAVDFCQHWLDAAAVASARCLGASEPAIRAFVAQLAPCLD